MWLDEMTALGQGAQYRAQIQQEIDLRVARMERLK